MPDEPKADEYFVEAKGAQVKIPDFLSAADQQALADDFKLPKSSPEAKAAAKKWKKKIKELQKAAKDLEDAAKNAQTPGAQGDAAEMAHEARLNAGTLQAVVLQGFGGKITMVRALVAGGIVVIIAVVIVIAGTGGGGGGGKGGGKHKAQQEKGAPKAASIGWNQRIVSTQVASACEATTTIEFTIVDGEQYEGTTAVVAMTGTENETQNVTVGPGGTFEVSFDHTLQPTGPSSCMDTEQYSLESVDGKTNVDDTQTRG